LLGDGENLKYVSVLLGETRKGDRASNMGKMEGRYRYGKDKGRKQSILSATLNRQVTLLK
jgi:hypothetical protein